MLVVGQGFGLKGLKGYTIVSTALHKAFRVEGLGFRDEAPCSKLTRTLPHRDPAQRIQQQRSDEHKDLGTPTPHIREPKVIIRVLVNMEGLGFRV